LPLALSSMSEKMSLEDELKALGLEAGKAVDDAKEQTQVARRMKKSSKDLTDQLSDMKATLDTIAGAASAWQALGSFGAEVRRERRGSKEIECDLKKVFNSLDLDGSGELEMSEVKAALMENDPSATDEDVEKLLTWADTDNNGKIDFKEYMTIMNYKAAVDQVSAPAAAPAAS